MGYRIERAHARSSIRCICINADALDYDKLKRALLKRYELIEEFTKCRLENGEAFQQFTTMMKSYFTRWIDKSV